MSLPTAMNSATVTAWLTVATSCTMIGPSSRPPVHDYEINVINYQITLEAKPLL